MFFKEMSNDELYNHIIGNDLYNATLAWKEFEKRRIPTEYLVNIACEAQIDKISYLAWFTAMYRDLSDADLVNLLFFGAATEELYARTWKRLLELNIKDDILAGLAKYLHTPKFVDDEIKKRGIVVRKII